jgi:hypothetical protein
LSLFDLLHRCQSHETLHSETQGRRQAFGVTRRSFGTSVVRYLGRRESRRARVDRSSDKSGSRTAWRPSISFATAARVRWPRATFGAVPSPSAAEFDLPPCPLGSENRIARDCRASGESRTDGRACPPVFAKGHGVMYQPPAGPAQLWNHRYRRWFHARSAVLPSSWCSDSARPRGASETPSSAGRCLGIVSETTEHYVIVAAKRRSFHPFPLARACNGDTLRTPRSSVRSSLTA